MDKLLKKMDNIDIWMFLITNTFCNNFNYYFEFTLLWIE